MLQCSYNSTALPSTDSWMESRIKKRQKQKGISKTTKAQSHENPFEELERFLRHPRLRQEDCPNPIPWWGVSILVCCSSITFISFNSFNLNTRFSVSWLVITLLFQRQHVLRSGPSHFRHALMTLSDDR